MAANTTSLGDHMYDIFGNRVLSIPAGGAGRVFVANLTSTAVLAGKVMRGLTLSGVLRRIPVGAIKAVSWGATQAVFGAETPDGAGRSQVPFTVTVPLRSAPYSLFPPVINAIAVGLSVHVVSPDFTPLPAGAYVTVHSSTLYYSTKPTFALDIPDEVAVGDVVEGLLRLRYTNGDVVEGQSVALSNATGDVALSFNGSSPANAIDTTSDAEGNIRFALHGKRAGGDSISVLSSAPGLFSPALNAVYPLNGSGVSGSCVVIPAAAAVPAVPGYETRTKQFGWDAGARSVDQLDDDVELSFTMETVIGVVVGLSAVDAGAEAGVREQISHGFFLFTEGGRVNQLQVIESGVRVGSVDTYAADSTFRIQRAGGRVFYSVENSEGKVYFRYASRVPLEGTVEAMSALYASGDFIPNGDLEDPGEGIGPIMFRGTAGGGGDFGTLTLRYKAPWGMDYEIESEELYDALLAATDVVITGVKYDEGAGAYAIGDMGPDVTFDTVNLVMSRFVYGGGEYERFSYYYGESDTEGWHFIRLDIDGVVYYGTMHGGGDV